MLPSRDLDRSALEAAQRTVGAEASKETLDALEQTAITAGQVLRLHGLYATALYLHTRRRKAHKTAAEKLRAPLEASARELVGGATAATPDGLLDLTLGLEENAPESLLLIADSWRRTLGYVKFVARARKA